MAEFIRELRKSNNMTQKQLAEKLNITDKAISKWKRGLSYPDITTLSALAKTLGVTTSELLNGEKDNNLPPKAETIIKSTLQYADKVTNHKRRTVQAFAKFVITFTFLLAIIVCTICDVAISHSFSWSLYPISSLVFTWFVVIPLFQFEKHRVFISLISFSIFIIPFLFILEKIIVTPKFIIPLGIPISMVSVIYLWIIYSLFTYAKISKWNTSAISILLGVPLSLLINYVVAKFTSQPIVNIWNILSFGIMIVLSVIFFYSGYFSKKKEITCSQRA